jgi:hypothetical protein
LILLNVDRRGIIGETAPRRQRRGKLEILISKAETPLAGWVDE